MGEIRSKVTLTNATDEVLQRRGKLAAADVHWLEADAVVDTGAVRSVIPVHIADRLDVRILAHVPAGSDQSLLPGFSGLWREPL